MQEPFKSRVPFEDRLDESTRIRNKFPGRIPLIVERARTSDKRIPLLDKEKFLVPKDLTVAQFLFIVRRRLTLPSEIALFLFINGTLPTTGTLMSELYAIHCDRDGFMYAQYSGENTFGMHGQYALFWGNTKGKNIIGVYNSWDEAVSASQTIAEKHKHPDGFAISMLRSSSKDQCVTRGYATLYNLYSAESVLVNMICAMPTKED